MIANCPQCGTHYKHEPPTAPVRARCGRCDGRVDLRRLRPYVIVGARAPRAQDVRRAAQHLRIGLDDPVLATAIARRVETSGAAGPVPLVVPAPSAAPAAPVSPTAWVDDIGLRPPAEASVPPVTEDDILAEAGRDDAYDVPIPSRPAPTASADRIATLGMWIVAGAIAGTGASWTMGGTTLNGIAVGAAMGCVAGWMWTRWTSPR